MPFLPDIHGEPRAALGLTKTAIAEKLGVSRRTVYHWIETGQLDRDLDAEPVRYAPRTAVPWKLDPYKAIIDERLVSTRSFPRPGCSKNVILLGPPGVGKTHLAISLAIAAAEHGRRVYCGTLADLITSLEEAKAAGTLQQRIKVLTHPSLLVVDEIGYLPVSHTGAMLFFQLINRRYERASTVLTSNKSFEDWGAVFGDEVMAAALIDRLLHHCHIVNIRGNSYRLPEALRGLAGTSHPRSGGGDLTQTQTEEAVRRPDDLRTRQVSWRSPRVCNFQAPSLCSFRPALTSSTGLIIRFGEPFQAYPGQVRDLSTGVLVLPDDGARLGLTVVMDPEVPVLLSRAEPERAHREVSGVQVGPVPNEHECVRLRRGIRTADRQHHVGRLVRLHGDRGAVDRAVVRNLPQVHDVGPGIQARDRYFVVRPDRLRADPIQDYFVALGLQESQGLGLHQDRAWCRWSRRVSAARDDANGQQGHRGAPP
jgi:hypothetical protein